jgi:hypothetical protein
MKQIPLTQGRFAIVDDDYERVRQFNWYLTDNNDKRYMIFRWLPGSKPLGKGKRIYLYRIIMKYEGKYPIFFINKNTFDLRKENLTFDNPYKKPIRIINRQWVTPYERKAKAKASTAAWQKCQAKTNIHFKLLHNVRSRLNAALARDNHKKTSRTIFYLGCTIEFFKAYIETQFDSTMTWDNHGTYWHLDHIRPCASYDLRDMAQALQCFNYKNYQPLEAKANQSKGAKLL